MPPGPSGFFSGPSTDQKVKSIYRGMPIEYEIQNGKAIFQGDIILESAGIDAVTVGYGNYLWPKVGNQYQIPYIIAAGTGNLTNLNAAISRFNGTFSNIQLVSRTTQSDYVNFYFDPNNNSGQCEASVGRIGGEQQVGGAGGSSNPCTIATILHELGHTVGLWHEQSRTDRDTYVSVNYGNLIKGSIANSNQIFDNAQIPTLFDYASVMEYPPFAFSRNGGPAIESIPPGIPLSNVTGYTATDVDGIERLYSNAPKTVTITSTPPGLQVIVDGVTLTTPQVFNWALKSTHTLNVPSGVQTQAGNIVNSTTPTTFYYVYGRWNDSTAVSHSISILPGNGEPTTPATSPAVTTYTANFIQIVPYAAAVSPSGTGTVTPSPAPQSYSGSPLVFYTARQQVGLTATPNAGQNFYEFNNSPFWLPGGLGANPKTFYVPDTGLTVNTTAEFSSSPVYTVNVAPNPFSSNLYVYADGNFWYAPKNFSVFYDSTWTPGSTHTLRVDNPEYPYSSNSRYAFANWSDGTNTATDSVVLPPTSANYTANLTPQFFVTDYVNETCAGSLNVSPTSPTGDGFYPAGSVLTFSETPNSGWLFTGWQYDLSGTSTSQALTVTDEALVAADYSTVATPLTLVDLSPTAAVAGGPNLTLTLNGSGFTPSSVVSVKGAFPAVKFISSSQVTVPVTSKQIATPRAFQVWIENFPSGAPCAAFAALPFAVASKPIISPSPSSVSFSPQALGTTSTSKAVKLTNTGASVNINSIDTTGSFAVLSTTCGTPLNSGASCVVNITFNPSTAGAQTGSLAVNDSAPDSPQTVALSGTGNLPLSISPASLSFGTVTVGHTSAAKTVTLTNNESSSLNLSFNTVGNYAINSPATTCGSSLASKAKCNIGLTFTPTSNGSINSALAITDTTGFSPQLVALSGTGSGGGTAPLTFTPTSLSFSAQAVGTASAAKALTVKNNSASLVTLTNIATTGDFSAAGSGSNPCVSNLNLAPAATCTLSVTFTPAVGASGMIKGAVIITDNAATNQQALNTTGTATLPLTFAPTTLTFPPQTVATTSAPQTVTLTNNLPTSLSPTIAGNGEYAASPGGPNPCSATLGSHASCTFNVTFTPSALGTRASAVTVTDGANPGVQTLKASGVGQ